VSRRSSASARPALRRGSVAVRAASEQPSEEPKSLSFAPSDRAMKGYTVRCAVVRCVVAREQGSRAVAGSSDPGLACANAAAPQPRLDHRTAAVQWGRRGLCRRGNAPVMWQRRTLLCSELCFRSLLPSLIHPLTRFSQAGDSAGQSNIFAIEPKTYVAGSEADKCVLSLAFRTRR